MSETVVIEGLDELLLTLSPESMIRLKRATLLGAGEVVRGYLAVYPGSPSYPLPWQSEKQRRWFWANVREGKIEVPYRRQQSPGSQRLGPSWAVEVIDENMGQVATRVTYARWVQSDAQQQAMHLMTGWVTDVDAVQRANDSGDLDEVWQQAFSAWLNGPM